MIEYIITHIFDAFGLNFFNRKGNKRGKTHFFQQQNAFFFKRIFCMQYVYGKFLKIMKIDLNTSKSMRITKMSKKKNIQFLVCKKVIFHYFQK